MAYCTREEFLVWSRTEGNFVVEANDEAETAAIDQVLEAGKEQIDNECGRTFDLTAAEARTFNSGNDSKYLTVDEFVGSATATRDGNAITVTAVPVVGRPSYQLRGSFGYGKDIIVTATWGWSEPPASIKQANLMLGRKLWERRKSPYGTEQGGTDLGLIRIAGTDRDVQALLAPYVRLRMGVSRR
jgi:hypothetical protein